MMPVGGAKSKAKSLSQHNQLVVARGKAMKKGKKGCRSRNLQ